MLLVCLSFNTAVRLVGGLMIASLAPSVYAGYVQINLTSNIPGLAAFTDPNLVNPWGFSFTATSPFWISDNGSAKATLYNAAGTPQALIVSTPPEPTGQVANSGTSFALTPNNPARFIFATESGQIAGWNPAVNPTAAVTKFSAVDGAVYTGLAIGGFGNADFLYAADFRNGKVDILDGNFTKIGTLAADPGLPAGYSPFNVQNINGKLYVEYALFNPASGDSANIPNTGVVDLFDTNGNFLQRLVTNTHLNAPWGVTLAPAAFGMFGGDLLVGNFGDGTISAFNPLSGVFLGTISDSSGIPIVNDGLWGIGFRLAGSGFPPNALYFTAGLNDEADGLFGRIEATPEPAAFGTVGLGLLALALVTGGRNGIKARRY